MQKLLTLFFSKNISIYAIFNNLSFNDTLTNDSVSFEQLGPELQTGSYKNYILCEKSGTFSKCINSPLICKVLT